jgi:hypothetical protein
MFEARLVRRTLLVRLEQLVRQVVPQRREHRTLSRFARCQSLELTLIYENERTCVPRGYVALAVASAQGTITTGSAQRDRNMVVFAEEALKLLLEVLQKDGVVAGL